MFLAFCPPFYAFEGLFLIFSVKRISVPFMEPYARI